MKSGLEVLEAAERLLIDKGWTRGAYARGWSGNSNYGSGDEECSYCAEGAIMRASLSIGGDEAEAFRAVRLALGTKPDGGLPTWNDAPGRTRGDVLALFAQAKEILRQRSI